MSTVARRPSAPIRDQIGSHATSRDVRKRICGDPADSFRNETGRNVRLLEVGMGGIQDDGNVLFDLVPKNPRETDVGAFGHPRSAHRGFLFRLVEINIEVLGLHHFPFEILVLNFVLPELSGSLGGGEVKECPGEKRAKKKAAIANHGNSIAPTEGEL